MGKQKKDSPEMEGQQINYLKSHQLPVIRQSNLTINSLNDDSLVNIFKYLSVEEKLRLEAVCKRWSQIAKLSWSNVRRLDVYSYDFKKLSKNISKVDKTNFLISILKRCNNYLITLDLHGYSMMDNIKCERFLKELPKYCSNVTKLDISDLSEKNVKLFNDQNLKLLFSEIVSLSRLVLKNLIIDGYCLLNLSAENIKELDIKDCEIYSRGHFYPFLSKLKNLTKLMIQYNIGDMESVIDALNMSQCENLEYIYICTVEDSCLDSLSLLLSKQTKLHGIQFNALAINREILESLSRESLKSLDLCIDEHQYGSDNPLYPLHRFENLVDFQCLYYELNDKSLYELSSFMNVNLKKIDISFEEHSVSGELASNFHRLQSLESFKIDNFECFESEEYLYIESIFKDLSKCKNLKKLEIFHCSFKISDFKCISFFPNLVVLNVCACNVEDNDIAYFIKKSLKLKKLKVKFCDKITKNLMIVAKNIKKSHKAGKLLEMDITLTLNDDDESNSNSDYDSLHKYKYKNLVCTLSYF